jgi:hypothetical protein
MNITPEEVYITYPVTLPLSMFRDAERAACHDHVTFNEYLIESIRLDLENFQDAEDYE